MTAQRKTGIGLAIFTSCVVLNHFFQRQLSEFDLIYGAFIPILTASGIWESKWLKGFQVAVIFLAGCLMVSLPDYSSRAVGMVIMAFAQMYSYTYGFLSTHAKWKLAGFAAVYLVIFATTQENTLTGLMWLLMCFAIHGAIWINAEELVEKARRLDEIEKTHLKQKVMASETLLGEVVDAGMVLVKEIKKKEGENGCEE